MRPILRYSIGHGDHRGVDCLRRSIERIGVIYPEFRVVILVNEGTVPPVAEIIDQRGHAGSLPFPPAAGFNVCWKLYPPRLDPEVHEVFLDNDIIIEKRVPEIDRFLAGRGKALCYEGRHGLYGRFAGLVPAGVRINSGIFGLPPGFDFSRRLVDVIRSTRMTSWGDYFDEQGLVATVLSRCDRETITQSVVPIAEDADEYRAADRGLACGWHFVGLNRGARDAYLAHIGGRVKI